MVSDSQVRCLELNSGATNAAASSEEEKIVEESVIQLSYSVDTLYFLVMGALVMFMAPGFAMLEADWFEQKIPVRF